MNPRQPDGTFRGPRQPTRETQRSRLGRWVEAEALDLLNAGVGLLSNQRIADHITAVGRGLAKALADTEAVLFPPNYSISKQAVNKAVKKALLRLPLIRAEEYRKIYLLRTEDMYLRLQPRMAKGDPRAIDSGLRVLNGQCNIMGLSPQQTGTTAAESKSHPITELLEALGPLDDEEDKAA